MSRFNFGVFVNDTYYNRVGEDKYFVNTLARVLKENSEGHKFNLSIDASTTCTGFCIVRDDLAIQMMFDYARLDTEKEIFFGELEYIIGHLVWGIDINLLLIEQPILQSRTVHTRNVLLSLCKRLKDYMKDVPELIGKKPIDIRPNSWKSWIFNGDKYKGGYNNKAVLATCLCERFPEYYPHLSNSTSKDYDCFDATAMLRYYMESLKSSCDGIEMNFASTQYTHISYVWAKFIPETEVPTKSLSRVADADVVEKQWNPEYNSYRNVKMASTGEDIVVMHITNELIKVWVCLEADMDLVPGRELYIRVMRKRLVTSSVIDKFTHRGYKGFQVY